MKQHSGLLSLTTSLTCFLALGLGPFSPTLALAAENAVNSTYTKLELTGSGTIQAAPDQLTASFKAESRSNSAAAAQQAVNAQVHKAAEQAAHAKDVQYAILNYSVNELRDDKIRSPSTWSASQNLTFTAANGDSLLPLTGQLQANGLLLQGLEWSLSADKQKKLQLEAEKAAVEDLKKQADTLATSLGLHVVRFESISVSGSPYPRPVFMAAMAARSMDSMPDPSSTAETQKVHASVTATALLAP